jgi:uncharacterized phage-associated protein
MAASVFDVAQYILYKRGPLSAIKLQKLIYYCQAWHLVWEDDILFSERIEAWNTGPIVPDLYQEHKGSFRVSSIPRGDTSTLTELEKDVIERVLKFYGDKDSQWLSDLTHMEAPWKLARIGFSGGDCCQNEITTESMNEYYSAL